MTDELLNRRVLREISKAGKPVSGAAIDQVANNQNLGES